jgi:hypothetical protein
VNDLHIHLKDCDITLHMGLQGPAEALSSTLSFAGASSDTREVKDLCDGKRVTYAEADKAVTALGPEWRLETPHELFALVDHNHQNANKAYTRDESIKNGPYWTNQKTPWSSEGRFVVYFNYGFVNDYGAYGTAFARAVRVSGQ